MTLAIPHTCLSLIVAMGIVALVDVGPAQADQVVSLARALTESEDHKERISAAVSLGRLKDKRSMKALLKGLRDEHRSVRALSAVALGRIGDRRALSALRRATKDSDEMVRRRAKEAIVAIKDASKFKVSSGKGEPGFGQNPRRFKRPTMYVVMQSAVDESPGRARKRTRKHRAAELKRFLSREIDAESEITTNASLAEKLKLTRYNLDASISSFVRRRQGSLIEVECEIRVAISDERGKMLSFMSGGAKVQVPRGDYHRRKLPQLRLQALENAVKGVYQNTMKHLRTQKRKHRKAKKRPRSSKQSDKVDAGKAASRRGDSKPRDRSKRKRSK